MTSKRGSLAFGFVALAVALSLMLILATVAFARVDEFGGAAVFAPYTETYAGTTNIAPHVSEELVKPFAPFTEKYAGTTNIAPHVSEELVKPFAPFTENYAGTTNIAPHVPSDQIKGPSAPYTETRPFWGHYLER